MAFGLRAENSIERFQCALEATHPDQEPRLEKRGQIVGVRFRLHGATVPVKTFGPLVCPQRFFVAADSFERFSASAVSAAECGPSTW